MIEKNRAENDKIIYHCFIELTVTVRVCRQDELLYEITSMFHCIKVQ